jgi:hypothetical protein
MAGTAATPAQAALYASFVVSAVKMVSLAHALLHRQLAHFDVARRRRL